MKYQCVECKEIFDEDEIIMSGVASGWGFGSTTIFCRECFERRERAENYCCDCKYWKRGSKYFFFSVGPCKSCKNHSNWESKAKPSGLKEK